jgi:hypothetical protein
VFTRKYTLLMSAYPLPSRAATAKVCGLAVVAKGDTPARVGASRYRLGNTQSLPAIHPVSLFVLSFTHQYNDLVPNA